MAAQGTILQVGCGNSELSAQMYDDGFRNMTNIDFSKVMNPEPFRCCCPRAPHAAPGSPARSAARAAPYRVPDAHGRLLLRPAEAV